MAQSRSPQPELFTAPPIPVAPLGDGERLAGLCLIRSENVGPATFQALINHYGGAEAALAAIPELARRGGRHRVIRICPTACAEHELASAARLGATPVFTIELGFPAALAAVDHPPPLLYVVGDTAHLNRPSVAIVGSRRCSAAGAAFARRLAANLGKAGFVIASGLARGIDAAAHTASLATGTIAVLAGGPDNIYPSEHQDLYREIAAAGCLVSERPPGFQPRGQDFPRRKRIISGLSHGVVIAEAARRSGSLTTARLAAEQGREVFAVPGHPLDPRAEGTNGLIKSGARMITSADDIVADLAPLFATLPRHRPAAPSDSAPDAPATPAPSSLSTTERDMVAGTLGRAPVAIDDICRVTGLAARNVQMALLELSLAGRIEHHGQHLVSLLDDSPAAGNHRR